MAPNPILMVRSAPAGGKRGNTNHREPAGPREQTACNWRERGQRKWGLKNSEHDPHPERSLDPQVRKPATRARGGPVSGAARAKCHAAADPTG
jgi:hypothetical protein